MKARRLLLKITLFLMTIPLTICACANGNAKIVVGMSYDQLGDFQDHCETDMGALTVRVYKWDDIYQVITLGDQWVVSGSAEFTPERKSYNAQGIEPLEERDDWERFLGMTVNEVEAELGEFHADIGSSSYMPSYVLNDGYLVCFDNVVPKDKSTRGEGIVDRIMIYDLFATDSKIVKDYKSDTWGK